MDVHGALVEAAITLASTRFGNGMGGAAAVYTASGTLLTSVGLSTPNAPANLCRETGAILEAVKRNELITAVVCVMRDAPDQRFRILAPCGICQERLWAWGGEDVSVAVPSESDPSNWMSVYLRDLQPNY